MFGETSKRRLFVARDGVRDERLLEVKPLMRWQTMVWRNSLEVVLVSLYRPMSLKTINELHIAVSMISKKIRK